MKKFFIGLFLSIAYLNSFAINADPKFVVGIGTFASSDDGYTKSTFSQLKSHAFDAYVGVSLFNRLAIYTNETPLHKGHTVSYAFGDYETKNYTTGVMYEFYQDRIGDHEFGFGASLNKNRIYVADTKFKKQFFMRRNSL